MNLGASASSAYPPAAGTVLPVGNGQNLSVVFTPADTAAYATASVNVAINVLGVDLDIRSLQVPRNRRLSREVSLSIVLDVQNNGSVNVAVPATIVGVQNGVQVYSQTMNVSAPLRRRANITFPPYTPTTTGSINWTATINDGNPDNDTASAVTRVVQ